RLGLTDTSPPPLPVLDAFLQEAEAFWSDEHDGVLRSPFWTERLGESFLHLSATALRLGSLRLLWVAREEEAFETHRRLAQLGRDAVLAREQLASEVERK